MLNDEQEYEYKGWNIKVFQELQEKCIEVQRIWQGPGQHSHELRRAMEELFALLPAEGSALRVQVSDSLVARSTFGGQ